jgi:NitT/TauT family transport system substrate-binding protein
MPRLLLALVLIAAAPFAAAQEKKPIPVTMLLNWYPQADHGGYFAAKSEGIYEKYGLDVTLKPGGPQVNVHQLLAAGQTDFIMGTQMRTLSARAQGVPIVTVAAFYQKDPTSIMVHEGAGIETLAALKGKPIHLPGIARNNYWPWLKARFGLADDQIKPYDPSFRAMSLDKQAGSQGFVTNDIFNCNKLGIVCKSLLLSDFGWGAYANTLDTTEKTIQERPELVRAFVKATNEGWKRYLENPSKAHALIVQMNPQQDAALMNLTYKTMGERGLLQSPDARGGKYGGMSDARWESFYKEMVEVGALPANIDYRKAYTLQFVKDL